MNISDSLVHDATSTLPEPSQRRRLRHQPSVLGVLPLVIALSLTRVAHAQTPSGSPVDKINAEAAKADIAVQPVRRNVSMLSGSGGNIAVLASVGGKLMVDAGIGLSRSKLSRVLAQVGPGAVKYLISTHWHWDHTDGNDWLHQTGATLIAHENTLKRLSTSVRVEDWSHTFPPAPVGARPSIIVTLEQKRRVSAVAIVVLLVTCALAAWSLGRSTDAKPEPPTPMRPSEPAAEAPAPRAVEPQPAAPKPAEPVRVAPVEAEPSASAAPAEPVANAPGVAEPSPAPKAPAAKTKAGSGSRRSRGTRTKPSKAEKSERTQRPANGEEFVNPWPSPR